MFWISFQDTSGKNLARMANQIATAQSWSLTDVSSTDGNPYAMQDIDKFPMTTLVFDNVDDRQAAGVTLDQFVVLGRGTLGSGAE